MISREQIAERLEAAKKTALHVAAKIDDLTAELHRQEGIVFDCQHWLKVCDEKKDGVEDGNGSD